jgi:hypothetical protein
MPQWTPRGAPELPGAISACPDEATSTGALLMGVAVPYKSCRMMPLIRSIGSREPLRPASASTDDGAAPADNADD